MSEPRPKIRVIMTNAIPRPICTAPKDGRCLLLFDVFDARWVLGNWNEWVLKWESLEEQARLIPSYWLPVPPSPNNLS